MKIKSIKRLILVEPIPVFDLEVEKYHNFAIGHDKCIVHNCEYLHGDASPVIVGMAQNFAGSNNLPLLDREGNFGNRFIPEASAPRYIYTNGSSEFFKLFSKDDTAILTKQFFEGVEIEPLFYVPSLPLLLINGNEGVATGFAQKILPRKKEYMQQYIQFKLTGSKYHKDTFKPFFEGFNGTVEQGENEKQWLIKGSFKKISLTKLEITEVPVGYALKDYIKILDALEEKGVIKTYQDRSENDIFNFIVTVDSKFTSQSDDIILDKLKLIKKVSENFTALDKDNKVQQFQSAQEIFDYYFDVKLEYLQLRQNYMISKINHEIRKNISRYSFIKNITEEKIKVNKESKESIISQIEPIEEIIKVENSYDYLLRMPIYSLTVEKMNELLEQIKKQKQELDEIKALSTSDIWQADLLRLGSK